MGNSLANTLNNFLDLFNAHTHKPRALKGPKDLPQLIEHIVDITDPRIRVISRYAQKLNQPLSHTWDYLNSMADMIPGGIVLDRGHFTSDPRLKLIFDSQGIIQQLLDDLPLLINEKLTSNKSDPIRMLLCMEKQEHNFLGSELVGDIIKRDVLQTKVSFLNRKILSAGINEDDVRLGFKNCALEGLLHKAHNLVLQSRNELRRLIERKKQLHQQLHTAPEFRYRPSSSIFSRNEHLVSAHPELQDIERQLAEIRIKSESPDEHLLRTIEVLNHPEQYLQMEKHSMRLNNLGVKLAGNSSENGFTIDYAEVEIENSFKRIAMIVDCAAEDVFPQRVH